MVHDSTCAELIRGGDGDLQSLVATVVSLRAEVMVLHSELAELRARTDPSPASFGQVSIKSIKSAVCEEFHYSQKYLTTRSRSARLVHARHIAAHLCCLLTRHSLVTIAENLGYRDHSPVSHGRDKIASLRFTDAGLDEMLTRMECELRLQTKKTVPTKR